MSRLILVRHGMTDYNSVHRFVGHTDLAMNMTGTAQVSRLRDRLAAEKIDAIFASDLQRAMVTASIIVNGRNIDIIPVPELREINYGKVEGLKFEEIGNSYPELVENFVNWSPELLFPGGESFMELRARIGRFATRLSSFKPEQTVLIVAHSGPLRLLICILLGMDVRHWRQMTIDLASVSIVHLYDKIAILNLLNDTSHLKDT